MPEQMIAQDQGDHCFYHGDCPGKDAGIVAAFACQGGLLACIVYGLLRFADSRRRLEGDANDDIFTIGNAALGAARAVCAGAKGAIFTAI